MSSTSHDVIICGSGSAGLCAATWLARMNVSCLILESRSGPMQMGQADGVQCRTVEVYDSFGIADEILREGHHQCEVTFWSGSDETSIRRTGRMADTPPGLSYQPHLILNQARMNDILIQAMKRFNGQDIAYGYEVADVRTSAADEPYPVTVAAIKDGKETTFKAKYVLGCDGAHSAVRRSLGFKMIGDSTDAVWGVIDSHVRTDFPDIRKKAVIQSKSGNILVIPREGGTLVRFYVEIPPALHSRKVTSEDLQAAVRSIFDPYQMDFVQVVWFSAYAIGQRYADNFHHQYTVFLTGDACHTHSPKAGQGMNVSLQDGYNIGWKLGHVLCGNAPPILLETYIQERRQTAIDLIEFDRQFTKLWSARGRNSPDFEPEALNQAFFKSAQYTAGLTAKYSDSCITAEARSDQTLATHLKVGMRFPSAQVVRLCDSRPLQLAKTLIADGRWRVVIFAGDIRETEQAEALQNAAKHLEQLALRFTPHGDEIDSFIEPLVVLRGPKTEFEMTMIPNYFRPICGPFDVPDWHKIYVDDEAYDLSHGHAYELYGIDLTRASIVVVRPDQYVSMVQVLDTKGLWLVQEFFRGLSVAGKDVGEQSTDFRHE